MLQAIGLVFLCLFSFSLTKYFRSRKAGLHYLPFLPGPGRWPFIGNIFNAPDISPWLTYKQWGRDCASDIVQFQLFSQQFIVVNSKKIAVDLFEKRSKIYSDKPDIPILKMAGWDFSFGNMPYGPEWRAHRRIFHEKFRDAAVVAYQPSQLKSVHNLLRDLVEAPEDFMEATKLLAASIIMDTLYGHKISDLNDRFVQNAEECMKVLVMDLLPGSKAMFVFPILRFFPSWFPGAGFKPIAKKCKALTVEMQNEPFYSVKENIRNGTATPSVTSELLERNKLVGGSEEQEIIVKRMAGAAYAAGSDTSAVAISSGILAMVLHPEAQNKAQAEIDRVVGSQRLPDFGDRESMPYVEALLREIMRWHPIVPIAGWHCTTEDDIYEGRFIPKGSYIVPNIWAMTRDESIYPEPEEFRPERYLAADGSLKVESQSLGFGFGRRICPGRFLADSTTWAAMSSMLAVFDFEKAKDNAGEVVEVKAAFTDGIISAPLPFQCSIKPRSQDALSLVQETTTSTASI